jgi:hypothetical protein
VVAQYLTSAVVGVTLSVLVAVSARHGRQTSEGTEVFSFSPLLGATTVACGLFLCAVPLVPGIKGNTSPFKFFLELFPFWGGAFAISAYLFRYRIAVTNTTLTIGAFTRKTFQFEDVIDWDIVGGQRGSQLFVYLRSGRKLRISGLIGDFDGLTSLVNSHMATPRPGQPDSVAKLRDRAARAQEARAVWWYLGIGVAIVVIFVWALRQLGYQ